MKQVHLIVSGDVTGVGYRAWAKARARELRLTGWVKNREDDSVELVASGKSDALDQFVTACKKGPDVAWVKNVDVRWQKGDSDFVDFEVLY